MNYYRRFIGDYLKKTARLSILEHGAYTLLLDHYYAEEGPLPADKREVYRLVRALDKDEQAAVDKVLARFFVLTAEGYRNERADSELGIATAVIETARENGKLGGRPKTQNITHRDTQTITREEPRTEPTGKPAQEPAGEPANNHPPTPIHQPPSTTPQPPTTTQSAARARNGHATHGEVAAALRPLGVEIHAQHATLNRWVEDGVTLERLVSAVKIARGRENCPARLKPAYLDQVVRDPSNFEAKAGKFDPVAYVVRTA